MIYNIFFITSKRSSIIGKKSHSSLLEIRASSFFLFPHRVTRRAEVAMLIQPCQGRKALCEMQPDSTFRGTYLSIL